jgi:hypothetical protein
VRGAHRRRALVTAGILSALIALGGSGTALAVTHGSTTTGNKTVTNPVRTVRPSTTSRPTVRPSTTSQPTVRPSTIPRDRVKT